MNPEAYQTRTYSSEKLIWRLRVDLEARILITTRHSYGLGVHDLDSGEMLWELMRSGDLPLRPFAHLEYDEGIMVFDRGTDELEVWGRSDLLHGESAERGHFTHIGLVPSVDGMRGFHLKQGELAIVSQLGTTTYYFLSLNSPPVHLRTLTHSTGAIGYVDKSASTLALCHGNSIRLYAPLDGHPQASFPPPSDLPLQHYLISRPIEPKDSLSSAPLSTAGLVDMGLLPLSPPKETPNPLPPGHPNANEEDGEWQACHLADDRFLVALSKQDRVLVCSDYPAVIAAAEKGSEEERRSAFKRTTSIFTIEPSDDPDSRGLDGGEDQLNWLSLWDGRAAFGASDHVLILPLPPPSSTSYPTPPSLLHPLPSVLALPTVPQIPISCLALTPTALFTTAGRIHLPRGPVRVMPSAKKQVVCAWFDAREDLREGRMVVEDDEENWEDEETSDGGDEGWEDAEEGDEDEEDVGEVEPAITQEQFFAILNTLM